MSTIGDYEAAAHFPELLGRVEGGEVVTITKQGSPIAQIVPIKRAPTRDVRRAAIEAWRALSPKPTLGGLKVKDLINEGRR